MDCRALLPHQLPHAPKLSRDYVEHFSKLQSFYAHKPDLKAVAACARKLKFPSDRRRDVAAILRAQNLVYGSGSETEKNLARLEGGAFAVVTGQQVGLFGGPAYAFYKALTAVQAAQELSRSGIPAVPVFWMATEDHDVDEVRHTTWFSDGKLRRYELLKPIEDAQPVGRLRLGEAVAEFLRELEPTLGETFAGILRESYTPVATYGSAFARLFARVFVDHGLILLDPLDEKLHRLAAPLLRSALAERDALEELLLKRGKEIERAGYEPQVNVTA